MAACRRRADGQLIRAAWPTYSAGLEDAAVKAELDWAIRLISEVRAARAEMNVPPGAKIPAVLRDAGAATLARLAASWRADPAAGAARRHRHRRATRRAAVQLVIDR